MFNNSETTSLNFDLDTSRPKLKKNHIPTEYPNILKEKVWFSYFENRSLYRYRTLLKWYNTSQKFANTVKDFK